MRIEHYLVKEVLLNYPYRKFQLDILIRWGEIVIYLLKIEEF